MPSVLLLVILFSLSGRAVTNVGRTCGPTLLLVHLYVKAIKYVLIQEFKTHGHLGSSRHNRHPCLSLTENTTFAHFM